MGGIVAMSSTINASTASGGGVITTADASGILQLQTGGTTALSIDAAQVITLVNALGGTPSAPTAAVNTSTTQLATTAFANPASSLAANGYVKLPSGIIMQWGTSASVAVGVITAVTFPIAFPTAVASVQYMANVSGNTLAQQQAGVSSKTTSGFSLWPFNSTTGTYSWFAIGY